MICMNITPNSGADIKFYDYNDTIYTLHDDNIDNKLSDNYDMYLNNFKEFYENEDKCKYKDCMHLKEDGCYIKELVENGKIRKTRYENYKKFIESIEELKR